MKSSIKLQNRQFNLGYNVLYGPEFLHILRTSVHRKFVNAFKVNMTLKDFVLFSVWNLIPSFVLILCVPCIIV